MNIHFYLNNEEETQITSFHDIPSNPFNVGDILNLDVWELYPIDYKTFTPSHQIKMHNDNNELMKLFKRKRVKIVREGKWIDFKIAKSPNLVIEYHCEFV